MTQQFSIFALHPLLPDGHQLILNFDVGILTQLRGEEIIGQQLLSPNEMYVVEALLRNYPEYCPYEVALSAMTGKSIWAICWSP
jgi:hypothetical protein